MKFSIWLLFATLLFFSCKQKQGTAIGKCLTLDDFQPARGTINTKGFLFGGLYMVDTVLGTYKRITIMPIADTLAVWGSLKKVEEEKIRSQLDIEFGGDLEKADVKIKAQIASAIQSATIFLLKEAKDHIVVSPASFVKYCNEQTKKEIDINFGTGENKILMFIPSMTYANDMSLVLKDLVKTNVKGELTEFGDYKVSLGVECDALYKVQAEADGVRYDEESYFTYNPTTKEINVLAKKFNLSNYVAANTKELLNPKIPGIVNPNKGKTTIATIAITDFKNIQKDTFSTIGMLFAFKSTDTNYSLDSIFANADLKKGETFTSYEFVKNNVDIFNLNAVYINKKNERYLKIKEAESFGPLLYLNKIAIKNNDIYVDPASNFYFKVASSKNDILPKIRQSE